MRIFPGPMVIIHRRGIHPEAPAPAVARASPERADRFAAALGHESPVGSGLMFDFARDGKNTTLREPALTCANTSDFGAGGRSRPRMRTLLSADLLGCERLRRG